MKLAIILPSRGLIFSRTVEQLFNALEFIDCEYKLYWSHDNPIPDCFNKPITEALKGTCTDIIIIEEDIQIPVDGLQKLLESSADIAFYDYPLEFGMVTNMFHGILMSGTGLIRFKREALIKLIPFRTDTELSLNPLTESLIPEDRKDKVYGKHDISMFYKASKLGMSIEKLGVTGHYRVKQLGEKNINQGVHQIINLLNSDNQSG